jgi:Ca2+-binding EF-hand superfamily protein
MIIGGDNRGGGPERGAGFGGGFAAGGFGGDTARKFKTAPLPDSIPEWFKRNDKDGDGQVAMFEWPKDDLQDFNKYDRNGDGFVTVAEAMHFAPKPPPATASNTPAAPGAASPAASAPGSTTTTTPGAPLASASTDDRTRNFAQEIVRRYDRNSDGKLDQQELQSTTRLRMGWQQFDANRDSILDLEEVTAYLRAQGGGFGGGGFGGPGFGGGFGGGGFGGGGFGGGGDPRGGRGNENPEEGMRRFLGRFDRNNDGKLARDEFPRFFPAERFDEMDTNRDGQIDTQEFTKGMEGMRGRFGGFGGGGGGPGGFGRGRGP